MATTLQAIPDVYPTKNRGAAHPGRAPTIDRPLTIAAPLVYSYTAIQEATVKRLTIKLDDDSHLKLKTYAVAKRATMQALIMESIAKLLAQPVNL